MKAKIYKYPLHFNGINLIKMPKYATIISCQDQKGVITLWATVGEGLEQINRSFEIFGTGHTVETENNLFIATVQQ